MDLGTLGGAYAQAWGINDSGFVTGNSQIKSDVGATHAFIWQTEKEEWLDLGTLAGDFSYGTFINANNHVVGYSTIKETTTIGSTPSFIMARRCSISARSVALPWRATAALPWGSTLPIKWWVTVISHLDTDTTASGLRLQRWEDDELE